LTIDRYETVGGHGGFLDVGLAAAVEILALLRCEEETPKILSGHSGIPCGREQ
jgi:hypothetical protein